MKRIHTTILIIAVLLLGIIITLGLRHSGPWYQSHGSEIISTTANKLTIRQVYDAIQDSHALCIVEGDGKRSWPTYGEGAKTWKNERGNAQASRAYSQFTTQDDINCKVEDIRIPGRPTLFLINADNSEAAMAIHNTIVETLVKNGVDLKK